MSRKRIQGHSDNTASADHQQKPQRISLTLSCVAPPRKTFFSGGLNSHMMPHATAIAKLPPALTRSNKCPSAAETEITVATTADAIIATILVTYTAAERHCLRQPAWSSRTDVSSEQHGEHAR
eukprot:CAMPEP_0204508224 /NCGR_PEP_ID=MMETSP0471-20130131/110160_1 /ASSEMBLY_ACC=CAM_ASM_000602 /TAXON_ID=2969 /ORGANISM="Oxyrrhis marina" /LENGTH=122 /DNA_ID=CAMNT_0051513259 /DNA_START=576 /DNA_END=945 /DNA_ORIENTATION=+